MPADASVLTLGSVAKYELREDASTVSIAVTDVSDQHEHLLRAFDDCRERRCSCPTDQYDKLASMQVDRDDDTITLHLEPKPGARFDTSEITTCLEHTIGQARDSQGERRGPSYSTGPSPP